MEAINTPLRQLESIEIQLYIQRQAAVQRRLLEDKQLQLKREAEDQVFLGNLKERDQEDISKNFFLQRVYRVQKTIHQGLRQQRRNLARASFTNGSAINFQYQANGTSSVGPMTRSKTKAKRTVGGAATKPKEKSAGLPTAHDSQGRPLYTPSSDGKLVYLRRSVAGCRRETFNTVVALRRHICGPNHRHKINGMFTSNDHAIEVCGQVAPGQEGFHDDTVLQPLRAAKVIMRTGNLTPATMNRENEGAPSIVLGSDTLVDLDRHSSTSQEATRVKDLGRAYRTSTTQQGGRNTDKDTSPTSCTAIRRFLSLDSKDSDSDEDEITGQITADKIDQRRAAKGKVNPSSRPITGRELFDMCAEIQRQNTETLAQDVMDQVVKEERHESLSLFLEQADEYPSPKSLVTSDEATSNPNLGSEAEKKVLSAAPDAITNRKRVASDPPRTPRSSGKRLRTTDEPETI